MAASTSCHVMSVSRRVLCAEVLSSIFVPSLVRMGAQPVYVIANAALDRPLGFVFQVAFCGGDVVRTLPIEVEVSRTDLYVRSWHGLTHYVRGLRERGLAPSGHVVDPLAELLRVGREDRRPCDVLDADELEGVIPAFLQATGVATEDRVYDLFEELRHLVTWPVDLGDPERDDVESVEVVVDIVE